MSAKSIATYVVLGLLTLGAYFSVKDFLAWPVQRYIIVSNMTVSYLLALLLAGGFSPKLTKRLWPNAPKWAFIAVAVVMGLAIVYVLKLLGTPTRI